MVVIKRYLVVPLSSREYLLIDMITLPVAEFCSNVSLSRVFN